MTHAHTIHRTFMFETLANRFEQPWVALQGDMQDSIFAQPKAALKGRVQSGISVKKRQDSLFTRPLVALQGDIQGCIS